MNDYGTDEKLMQRYATGDAKAFEWLYARHKGSVYRDIRDPCADAATADELFQDVWMNLVTARERYSLQAKFTTYLYRIARNPPGGDRQITPCRRCRADTGAASKMRLRGSSTLRCSTPKAASTKPEPS